MISDAQIGLSPLRLYHEREEDYKLAATATGEPSCRARTGAGLLPDLGVDWGFQSQESSKPWLGQRSKEPQPAMKWRGKEGGERATYSKLSHSLQNVRWQTEGEEGWGVCVKKKGEC